MSPDTHFQRPPLRRLFFTGPELVPAPTVAALIGSESPNEILQAAREKHADFYDSADTHDAFLLDDLLLARAALMVTRRLPLDTLDPAISHKLVLAAAHLEQVFAILAEGIRKSVTFSGLSAAAKAEFAYVLQVTFPGEE